MAKQTGNPAPLVSASEFVRIGQIRPNFKCICAECTSLVRDRRTFSPSGAEHQFQSRPQHEGRRRFLFPSTPFSQSRMAPGGAVYHTVGLILMYMQYPMGAYQRHLTHPLAFKKRDSLSGICALVSPIVSTNMCFKVYCLFLQIESGVCLSAGL